MKMTSKPLGLIIALVFVVGISSTMMMGIWTTETTKEPAKYVDEDLNDQYNPSDIRGSYTFADISELFQIDEEVLRRAFGLGEEVDLNVFATKNLETIYGESETEIGNGSVRLFVALYLNLPIELGDDYLLEEAVEIVKNANGQLTVEQQEYLDTHTLYYDELIVLAPEE